MIVETCPKPEILIDFLLGKLPSDQQDYTESHIADCEPCGDTIRSLKIDDTLTDLTELAWKKLSAGQPSNDQLIVDDLIEKMKSVGEYSPGRDTTSHLQEDRAAEVQRLLQPSSDDGSLGRVEHYRIQELLGAGSSGVVYRAIDENLQRTVALKILRPSLGPAARDRFIAEARATAALEHANVVTIYQVGISGPLAYIAMQWMPGQTLEQLLETHQTMPVESVRTLGAQIAKGLSAAHANGLIHRDIKPANIWVDSKTGDAKILDFGLVRVTDEDPQLTCTGLIAGTPCYMSPEQSRGAALDARSDIFSLGCVLYQAMTGQLPFRSENALATLQSIQRDQPVPPHDLDPSIPRIQSNLIMCLLEKSPNKRPPSAGSVAKALEEKNAKNWTFEVDDYQAESDSTVRSGNSQGAVTRWVLPVFSLGLLLLGSIWFGPQITRIITDRGEIIIESNDPNVEIEILQNGKSIHIFDLSTKNRISIKSGEYEIRALGEGNTVTIDRDKLTLKRGSREIVKVTRSTGKVDLETSSAHTNRVTQLGDYRLDAGDVLAIYIEGVLGQPGEQPPIHYPPPESGLLPCMGYPVPIRANGTISLPLVDPISVRGLTISQAESLVKKTFVTGDENAVLRTDAGILVDLMRPRNYSGHSGLSGDPDVEMSRLMGLPSAIANWADHTVAAGDVLGIYIEGVLGDVEQGPPVYHPPPNSGLPPSVGFPIHVRSDGTISLPLVPPLKVVGKSVEQIEFIIKQAYHQGDSPILVDGRILVNLMRVVHSQDPNLIDELLNDPEESSVDEPVYQNKTYDQWLAIAKREVDPEAALKAMRGLAALASDSQKAEVAELLSQHLRRPNPSSDVWRMQLAVFRILDSEQLTNFYILELERGNSTSRATLDWPWTQGASPGKQLTKKKLRQGADKILAAAEELMSSSDETTREFAENFVQALKKYILDEKN